MNNICDLPGNTPVIVGVGFCQQHSSNPKHCDEAIVLMERAVFNAADDAGLRKNLDKVDSISVPQGLWSYGDPGSMLAEAIGAHQARTILSDVGILQLQLLTDVFEQIQKGQVQCALVAGGEARYREQCAKHSGIELANSINNKQPDLHLQAEELEWPAIDGKRGLSLPADFFALVESSIRFEKGLSHSEHRDQLADLYSNLSYLATDLPNSWYQQAVEAKHIRGSNPDEAEPDHPTTKMIAFPYTKYHCSQWNVNQASALIICSLSFARQQGIEQDRFVFPLAATSSTHVEPLSQRPLIHRTKGAELAAQALFNLSNMTVNDVDHFEIYSCFPSSLQSLAMEIGIDSSKPLTISGGMHFGGGPFNNFSLQGTAHMVEKLRTDSTSRGLVAGLSGILAKQTFLLLSTHHNEVNYRFQDVTKEASEQSRSIEIDEQYSGIATIVAYTITHHKGLPTSAIAICDTVNDRRTVANTTDCAVMVDMMKNEYCGKKIEVLEDGSFVPIDSV